MTAQQELNGLIDINADESIIAESPYEAHSNMSDNNCQTSREKMRAAGGGGMVFIQCLVNDRTCETTISLTALTMDGHQVMVYYSPESIHKLESFSKLLSESIEKAQVNNQTLVRIKQECEMEKGNC